MRLPSPLRLTSVVALVLLAPSACGSNPAEPAAASAALGTPTARAAPSPPTASTGTRRVGANGVMIDVPVTWHFGRTPLCGAPPQNSWWFTQPALQSIARCPAATPRTTHSSVAISGVGDPVHFADLPRAVEGSVLCNRVGCVGQWTSGRGPVRFLVGVYGSGARARVSRMGSSVRAVPAGLATVPFLAHGQGRTDVGPPSHQGCVALLERANLVVDDAWPGAASCSRRTDPPQGAVVPTGSTVTLE